MNTKLGLIGMGAALMYVFDPERGRRRRARLRDKIAHTINVTKMAANTTAHDLRNRAKGIVAETRTLLSQGDEVSDDMLIQRVRSKMGHVVSHPHAIEVTANLGRVTLSGPILESEVDNLLSCVSAVRGVNKVDKDLQVYHSPGNVPELQGGGKTSLTFELMQAQWSPTARLLAASAGGALMAYCVKRRDPVGVTAGTLGFCLFMRGLTRAQSTRRDPATEHHPIDIRKTINIDAGVERVFEFCTNLENLPRFMRNVSEVRRTADRRYHWTVTGRSGATIEWDAEIVMFVPNQILAWRTAPGSLIEHAGIIYFDAEAEHGTCLNIEVSYNPPAGIIGRALAELFGANPKMELDEDLGRMKNMLETEKPRPEAPDETPAAREASASRQ